jgi:gluconokinase
VPGHVIGVDIGTTATKAVVFDMRGRVVAHRAVGYPLSTPVPGAAVQDPDAIHRAVIAAIGAAVHDAQVAPDDVACVAFSAAMHSVIAVADDGTALTPSITWADNRAARWAERIRSDGDGMAIYRRTGTPIHPMSPLVKLAWLKDEDPRTFAAAARFIGIKEYVFKRLFDRYIVDHSIASATGLFNLEKLDWDEGALAAAGVTRERLSTLVPTTCHVEGLDPQVAAELGLDAATPFVIGANDGALSNVGVDAIQPGDVAVTIGTSGAMRTVVRRPMTDPAGRTFCYALLDDALGDRRPGQQWRQSSSAGCATRSLHRNARRRSASGSIPTRCSPASRSASSPGSEGLIFHPYLAASAHRCGTPIFAARSSARDASPQGAHDSRGARRRDLQPLQHPAAMEEKIGRVKTIKATGGFARSELWRQMMADVFDREVIVPESFESSCLGARVLGLYALGYVDSLRVISHMVGATHRHTPIATMSRSIRSCCRSSFDSVEARRRIPQDREVPAQRTIVTLSARFANPMNFTARIAASSCSC